MNSHNPEFVFLDIQMPGLSGFEVARRLLEREIPSPALVFVTAFDQHAIEALEVNAVDYPLKPVDRARLEQALYRAGRWLGAQRTGDPINDQLERIVKMMADRQTRHDQVAVRAAGRFLLIQTKEIIFPSLACESINIVTGQVTGTANYRTLDELQARLDPDMFLAGASLASGQYQQDQGDRPLVQQELHRSDEGRGGHGDTGQPLADEAAPGASEALKPEFVTGETPASPETSEEMLVAAAEPVAPAAAAGAETDMRLALDNRTAAFMQRLRVWMNEIVAWFKTLASAAVYATLIVTFGFQVARVEGLSMAPTLADQDRLIVNKLAYRIGEPRRGDIVMLYYPIDPDKSFVKRVIAEEGDQVRIVDGSVFVNDVPMQDDFVPPEYRGHDDFGPSVIPAGYYFVMGDHRNNSSDSRHWGFVPKKYIIGKVQLRWWPIPSAHVF